LLLLDGDGDYSKATAPAGIGSAGDRALTDLCKLGRKKRPFPQRQLAGSGIDSSYNFP
jgi:hypothetical protein